MIPFIPDSNLVLIADMKMGTADTSVVMNVVQDVSIPVSADDSAISGSLHHAMSDDTSPSGVAPSDNLESNPDIVKAELSFYKTPHIRDYEEAVYSTLKSIELTCAVDFASMCDVSVDTAQPAIDPISFGLSNRKILAHAKSLSQSETAIGEDTVNIRESIMVNRQGEQEDNAPKVYKNLRGKNGLSSSEYFNIVGLIDKKSKDDKGEIDHLERKGEDELKHRGEHHAPRPNSEHHYPDGFWSAVAGDEEDSEDEGNHHGHKDHDRRRGPPHSRGREDYLFVGSLGYGDAGDMCMYDNFQKLAAPCQSSIADLHSLRQQYWKEETMARNGRGDHSFFLSGVFVVLFVGLCILRRSYCSHMAKERQTKMDTLATLALIDADPALKAQCKKCFLFVLVD